MSLLGSCRFSPDHRGMGEPLNSLSDGGGSISQNMVQRHMITKHATVDHHSSLESVGLRADKDSWATECEVTNQNGQSGKSTFPGVSCDLSILPPGGVQVGKAILAEGLE